MKRSARRMRTRGPQRVRVRLEVLQLEDRRLLSGLGPLLEAEPNDTLDMAEFLSVAADASQVEVRGAVGNGAAGAADVDWYFFRLETASRVHLALGGEAGDGQVHTLRPVLGLYNANRDPFDFSDPSNPTGHRLLAQTAEGSGEAVLDRDLAAGTYQLAVSGGGNRYFHPFLAGSGNDGQLADYRLVVAAATILRDLNAGPSVLSFDPGGPGDPGDPGGLASSPLVLRLPFDAPIDPGTLSPGANVRLVYSPGGAFGDGADQDVLFASCNWSAGVSELQLVPIAPLKPGFYQLFLAGDSSNGAFVLLDPNGVPLGADAAHPFGRDYSRTFEIAGVEGRTGAPAGADDTAPFARDLGELQPETRVQVTGAIGDDPYYDPTRPDLAANPSADVDLYRFRIRGPGRYALVAEVFAGRIGSSADPGVSLFRADPATGLLVFLDGNNNSRNPAAATNGGVPLHDDPVLSFGLAEGDYWLAVSSNSNTPTALEGGAPGANGIFDPNVSHSGQNGFSTGPYVLNVGVHRDDEAPEVAATSPAPDETLRAPPTELLVRFTDAMNLRKRFFLAFEQTSQQTVSAVFVEGADGARYFPRLESYNDATNEAHFLMLDGLANGAYQLHLSGALGLADLAGNPLVGNGPSGDYVVSFAVDGPARGAAGDPLRWAGSIYTGAPQDLGVLFPHELQAGVTIACDFTTDPDLAGSAVKGMFQFQVLQNQTYVASLSGADLPADARLEVMDLQGNLLGSTSPDVQTLQLNSLRPGVYLMRVEGWSTSPATQVAYQLRLELLGNSDNPPPLTAGPAPALRLALVSIHPAAPQVAPPQVALPPSLGNGASARPTTGAGATFLALAASSNTGPGSNIELAALAPSGPPLVVFPAGTLLQFSRGPLGGVASSGGPDALAAADREGFRLPDASSPAAPLAVFTSSLLSGSVENAACSPAADGADADAAASPQPQPHFLSEAIRSAARHLQQVARQVGDLLVRRTPSLESEHAPPLESAALSTDGVPSRTAESALALPRTAAGPADGRSATDTTADTTADTTGGGVAARVALWMVAMIGAAVIWRARRRSQACVPGDPFLGTGEARVQNLEEVAS